MVSIRTQRDLRARQQLSFCYLCGQSLHGIDKGSRDRDHVPPSSVFLASDRNPPLWMPTHKTCNNRHSRQDETIKQLVMLLHETPPQPRLLPTEVLFPEGNPFTPALVTTRDFRPIIWRWIRGFHAALYGVALNDSANHYIQLPLPSAVRAAGLLQSNDRLQQATMFVDVLKRNRAVGRVDSLTCRNDKCQFDVVWDRAGDNSWICIFGLQLYDWQLLGDGIRFPKRGCVGAYQTGASPPDGASRASVLELPRIGGNPLNPF